MAINVRFHALIVRKDSIEAKYHGGLKWFRVDWNGKDEGEDEHLIAFASMGFFCYEVAGKLLDCGLEQFTDFTFVDGVEGVDEGCDWLEVSGDFMRMKVCWLRGTLPGDAVEPIFL